MLKKIPEEQPELKGLVFNIERFCVHDGPGIRTLVFLKGCPLSCWWCANPEGMNVRPQVAFFPDRCIGCGNCVDVCPENAALWSQETGISYVIERCRHCAECVEACPSRARILYGKQMSVGEVFEEIEKDRPFYRRSHGGVTLSGGEPLLQKTFTRNLLQHCAKNNLHTAVETSGQADWETVCRAFEFANLILFDFKHIHPLKHLKFTGSNNLQILDNLKRLDEAGRPMILRVPVIPEFNASREEMRAMAQFAAGLKQAHACHLLPYHAFADAKYHYLGMSSRFPLTESPPHELMEEFLNIWIDAGIEAQIGG